MSCNTGTIWKCSPSSCFFLSFFRGTAFRNLQVSCNTLEMQSIIKVHFFLSFCVSFILSCNFHTHSHTSSRVFGRRLRPLILNAMAWATMCNDRFAKGADARHHGRAHAVLHVPHWRTTTARTGWTFLASLR
mmetsp:Transcript_22399/g.36095  ORF Transcript_22399/g.36095 Transcript_22399/m.36095 type:complete len:132 (-) Transcript_22399:20-415(-)